MADIRENYESNTTIKNCTYNTDDLMDIQAWLCMSGRYYEDFDFSIMLFVSIYNHTYRYAVYEKAGTKDRCY